jgi:hypothetical protein
VGALLIPLGEQSSVMQLPWCGLIDSIPWLVSIASPLCALTELDAGLYPVDTYQLGDAGGTAGLRCVSYIVIPMGHTESNH